jgi:hypothetical protein
MMIMNGRRGIGARKYIADGWRWKKRKVSDQKDTFLFPEDGG